MDSILNYKFIIIICRSNVEFFTTLLDTRIDSLINPNRDTYVAISGNQNDTASGKVDNFPFMATCNIHFTAGNKFYFGAVYTYENWRIRPVKMIGMFKR